MISPIFICDGVIRSGSTWSYNVCRLLGQIRAKRRGEPFGIACLGENSLDQFLQVEATLGSGSAVIKAHELGPFALQSIRGGRVKAVCTYRDPRDCVASDLVFWAGGFEASLQRVARSFDCLMRSYQDSERTLFVRYEEMIEDPPGEIAKIAEHLEIPVDRKIVDWIDGQTNIEFSRTICGQLASRPAEQVDVGRNNHRRDRVTLLHDNHIGSARPGRWRRDLTPQQGQLLSELFGGCLQTLGYGTAGERVPFYRKAAEDVDHGENIPGAVEE